MKVTNGLLNSVPTLLATSSSSSPSGKQRPKLPLHSTNKTSHNNHTITSGPNHGSTASNSIDLASAQTTSYHGGQQTAKSTIVPNHIMTANATNVANIGANLTGLNDDDFIGSASEFIKGRKRIMYIGFILFLKKFCYCCLTNSIKNLSDGNCKALIQMGIAR